MSTTSGNTVHELSVSRGASLLWFKKKKKVERHDLYSDEACGWGGEEPWHFEILAIAAPGPGWSPQQILPGSSDSPSQLPVSLGSWVEFWRNACWQEKLKWTDSLHSNRSPRRKVSNNILSRGPPLPPPSSSSLLCVPVGVNCLSQLLYTRFLETESLIKLTDSTEVVGW